MKYIKDQYGFTLVTAIVSMGIMGLVALGFMKLTKMQSKSTKYYETRSNEREVVNNIRLFLRDRQACENTLAGINAPGANLSIPLTMIKTSTNLTVFETDNPEKYGLKSITMNLTNPFNVGANTRGPFVIEVDFVRSDNAIGIKEKKEEVLLDIQTGPAVGAGFDILTCFTDGENNINTAIQEICKQAGGTPIEITNPAAIMANGGIKWRCEFFDLYLGLHNGKQCKSLHPAVQNPDIIRTHNGVNYCMVTDQFQGWEAANKTWTQFENFFSARPPAAIDCKTVETPPTNINAGNFNDFQSGMGSFSNVDESTGVMIGPDCSSRAPLPFTNHPAGAEECSVTCRYNEVANPGATRDVTIQRNLIINARGFY